MSRMTDFTVPSTVPGRTLHAFCCEPEGEVRAVLQLSHGMVEFIDRYKPLAEYLAGQGIVVVGHDHLGHGGSIRTKADYGGILPTPYIFISVYIEFVFSKCYNVPIQIINVLN